MAGLVKAKKYDWNDSNLALFGSDTEKNVSFDSPQNPVHTLDSD
jgi:gelsolin